MEQATLNKVYEMRSSPAGCEVETLLEHRCLPMHKQHTAAAALGSGMSSGMCYLVHTQTQCKRDLYVSRHDVVVGSVLSYLCSRRNSAWANSALVVSMQPQDWQHLEAEHGALAGMALQVNQLILSGFFCFTSLFKLVFQTLSEISKEL